MSFMPVLVLDHADVLYLLARDRTSVKGSYEISKNFTENLGRILKKSASEGRSRALARIRDSSVLLFSSDGQREQAADYLLSKGVLEQTGDLSGGCVRRAMRDLQTSLDYRMIVESVESGFVMHERGETVSNKFSITVDFEQGHKFNALGCAGVPDERASDVFDTLMGEQRNYGLLETFEADLRPPLTAGKREYEDRPQRSPHSMASVKWLGASKKNRDLGLPRSTSMITLNERETGVPLAIMRSDEISAARTGAYAAVAHKYLGHEDMSVGVLGSGVMAEASLRAIDTLVDGDVSAWSPTDRHACRFAERISQGSGLSVSVKPLKKVCGSDMLIGATSAMSTITQPDWISNVKLFVEINGREHPYEAFLDSDKIVCDDWEHVKHRNSQNLSFAYYQYEMESGIRKRVFEERNLYANIGEIVLKNKPGRESLQERIYSLFVGLGDLDHNLAVEVYNRARNLGIGKWATV